MLLFYWFKRRTFILKQVNASRVKYSPSKVEMYKELISYALPLAFVGLAIPLFQLIDLFTVNNALIRSGLMDKGETLTFFAVFTQTAHKIILIPMALATAFSITLIPTITTSFISNDTRTLQHQITKTFQIILLITLPASFGMSVLSSYIFGTLYGLDSVGMGGMVLQHYAPIALFFSLFSISAAILQGINKQKYAVIALTIGLLVKLSLNYALLYKIGALGGILATYLGFATAVFITMWGIRKYANYPFRLLKKHVSQMVAFSSIMSITLYYLTNYLQLHFPYTSWENGLIILVAGVTVGSMVYVFLCYQFGLVSTVLGNPLRLFKKNVKSSEG
ncbi:polysaccharide biosynthesis C-terminal domain-containing protein [Halalkalibacter urbisdiaboli]|uniref:lipid II flippase MurJ n=1 Tax=Halalkalibacter urbisdiaboli TaxID=1960589 RepID=UPI00315B2EDE